MDERNEFNNNEAASFENTAETPVENNMPTPEPAQESAPAPETPAAEEQPKPKKKGTKDFTPEEVKAILARAAKVDLSRVAKEFNTSWQAISALQKAEEAGKTKSKQKPSEKVKKQKVTAASNKPIKRSEEFSQKEKDAILERARLFGFRDVAAEVGTNWQTLASWNKQQRAAAMGLENAKVKKGKAKNADNVAAAVESKKSSEKTNTAHSSSEALEIENAILKEKLSILNQQVEKLRAAVGNLA